MKTSKKLTSILLALVMVLALLPFGAATAEAAQSGSCGSGVTWKLDNGTLTISGSGKMTDFTDENLPPWIDYIEDVTKIVVSSGVTRIGDVAFIYCINAASVSIASSVKEIGEGALAYCYGLESITLPSGLKKIGSMAFFGCISLTSMRVPAAVTEIGEAAFSCCGSMTGFQVDSGNASFSSDGKALLNKAGTKLLEFCAQAKASYTVPSTVKTIGEGSFCGLQNTATVTIPASVTTVQTDAFVACLGLKTLKVNSENTKFATDGKSLMNKDKTKIIEFCSEYYTSYKAPATVTALADYAFANCTSLNSVNLNNTGVKTISEGAFYGCTGLGSVTLPAALTKVGDGSFYGCTALSKITMKKVQTIGAAAFAFTGNFTTDVGWLIFPKTLKTIGENAFYCSAVEKISFLTQ